MAAGVDFRAVFQQHAGDVLVTERSSDHERGLATVVLDVDVGSFGKEELDVLKLAFFDLRDEGFFGAGDLPSESIHAVAFFGSGCDFEHRDVVVLRAGYYHGYG